MQPSMQPVVSLALLIKEWGRELGFQKVGIAGVDLAADEQLQVGQVGDGTHAWIVRAGGRTDVVLAVVPAGAVSVGLESELRGLDQRVEPEEAATFEARWQTDWAAGDREGAPAPKLWRFRGLETRR